MYAKAIRIISFTTIKITRTLGEVKKAIHITNPDCNIVIKRQHIYYKMKLVTFGIDEDRNLIIQFPVFVQPHTQQLVIMYQLETAQVPIVDQNKHAHSCTQLQIDFTLP